MKKHVWSLYSLWDIQVEIWDFGNYSLKWFCHRRQTIVYRSRYYMQKGLMFLKHKLQSFQFLSNNLYLLRICHADICVALFWCSIKYPTWLTKVCNSSGRDDVSSITSKGGNWCSRSLDFWVYEEALQTAVRRTQSVDVFWFFRDPGVKIKICELLKETISKWAHSNYLMCLL